MNERSLPPRLGNYRVGDAIEGGHVGVHLLLPRRALIKIAAREHGLALLREACLLEALHHPGIVRVFESGLLPDRAPWFACELVEGPTLQQALAPGAIAPGDRALAVGVLRDLAEVLEHAHRRGVIHCGLRPSRVVLTGRTRVFPVCVTGWSDARAHDAAPALYKPSVASWHYTSPELACAGVVPHDGVGATGGISDRVDVYALGVIAYQLLAGVLPFAGRVATGSGDVQHMPTEVHCPDLPRELTQLVDQMLAYDQWDRPSSAEVARELTWLAELLALPVAAPVELPVEASGGMRIRRPRWTPAITFDAAPPPEPARDRASTDREPDRS